MIAAKMLLNRKTGGGVRETCICCASPACLKHISATAWLLLSVVLMGAEKIRRRAADANATQMQDVCSKCKVAGQGLAAYLR